MRREWVAKRSGDLNVSQMYYARQGIITEEMHYVAKRSDLEWTARDLFKAIGDGTLNANINYEYPLKDAVQAHKAIESGTTRGATVLIP